MPETSGQEDQSTSTTTTAFNDSNPAVASTPVVFLGNSNDSSLAGSRTSEDKPNALDDGMLLPSKRPRNANAPLPSVAFSDIRFSCEPQPSSSNNVDATDAADNVLVFLRSLPLSFQTNMAQVCEVRARLAAQGFDSVRALAMADRNDLVAAGLTLDDDLREVSDRARHLLDVRGLPTPPDLDARIVVTKYLELCGIPHQAATEYSSRLQLVGYDSVQALELIERDERALHVFRRGHCLLFLACLREVLARQQQPQPQQQPQQMPMYPINSNAAVMPTYGGYSSQHVNMNMGVSLGDAAMYPDMSMENNYTSMLFQPQPQLQSQPNVMNPQLSYAAPPAFYPTTSFRSMLENQTTTQPVMMPQQQQPTPPRVMNDMQIRALNDAVAASEKNVAPGVKRGRIDFEMIATSAVTDERWALLRPFSVNELEYNYALRHDAPHHASGRSSGWTPQLVHLLWEVSQDTRCKSGNKTMWEQIAKGRTGVERYEPLARFSNSQLRSRYRTEFGDKRPQSRRNRAAAASGRV